MTKFSGACVFTQSDEMTILIRPANIVRGKQECHPYNGRVAKLGSLAASLATAVFCRRLFELQRKRQSGGGGDGGQGVVAGVAAGLRAAGGDGGAGSQGRGPGQAAVGADGEELTKSIWATDTGSIDSDLTQDLLPTFDCRVGSYTTEAEAMALILWRGYDCCINSVSDAVHHSRFPADSSVVSKKEAMRQGTSAKLRWLHHHGALPIPEHQANGSLFVKVKRQGEGFNPRTNETVQCLRSVIERVPGNVLVSFASGALSITGPM
mmetsp:Transcript_34657/g.92234  ORF Transcript_34657/g.92234 Transcript_34657/m.92234 type:complete len:265 (+) Transcript_34657:826-1620(+)